ncbi:major capsid protein P2 [Undibacterium sp. SXout11W]|uniref:major capsid protein P2 n=1 Tax=Undibacterium sp. SXout11W TaxID=3413050 RepID=UPI003BF233F7
MFDKLNDFQNRAPGSVAVITIPNNRTLDKLHISLPVGMSKSQITRIEGKIQDRRFFVDTGALGAAKDSYLNSFAGYVDPQVITIDFTEPNARGGAPEMYLTSVPVNLCGKVTFEVTIDPSVTVAQAAAITASHEFRAPTANPFILNRKDSTLSMPFTGDNDIILPSGRSGGLIKRMWIHQGNGNITGIELRGDNKTLHRWTDMALLAYSEKRNGMVPQPNMIALDFVDAGNTMQAVNTMGYTETLLRVTVSAPDTGRAYVDFVKQFSAV